MFVFQNSENHHSRFPVFLGLVAFFLGFLFLSPVRVSARPSQCEKVWTWNAGWAYSKHMDISKRGEYILVWEETGYKGIWLFSKSSPTPLWKKEGTSAALSPGGEHVALSKKGSVQLIQTKGENLIRAYNLPFNPEVDAIDIDISEEGPYTLVETTGTTYPYWIGGHTLYSCLAPTPPNQFGNANSLLHLCRFLKTAVLLRPRRTSSISFQVRITPPFGLGATIATSKTLTSPQMENTWP